MGKVAKLLGMAPPKPKGPDPSILKAQQKQQERLDRQEQEQKDEKSARRRLVRGQQKINIGTLFSKTGEAGVGGDEKLGGE